MKKPTDDQKQSEAPSFLLGKGGPAWRIFADKVRGASHVKEGLPCQDAFIALRPDELGSNRAILAVSDGHGGKQHFYSEHGARIATEVAVEAGKELLGVLLSDLKPDGSDLIPRTVSAWRDRVMEHARAHRNSLKEEAEKLRDGRIIEELRKSPYLAYGATLLLAILDGDKRCLYLYQLGDGDCVIVWPDGRAESPFGRDESSVTDSRTHSLCMPTAEEHFKWKRISFDDKWPSLLALTTDGYANSFSGANFNLAYSENCLKAIRLEPGAYQEGLKDYLNSVSSNGSADDITMALLYREGEAEEAPKDAIAEPAASDPAIPAPAVEETPDQPESTPPEETPVHQKSFIQNLMRIQPFAGRNMTEPADSRKEADRAEGKNRLVNSIPFLCLLSFASSFLGTGLALALFLPRGRTGASTGPPPSTAKASADGLKAKTKATVDEPTNESALFNSNYASLVYRLAAVKEASRNIESKDPSKEALIKIDDHLQKIQAMLKVILLSRDQLKQMQKLTDQARTALQAIQQKNPISANERARRVKSLESSLNRLDREKEELMKNAKESLSTPVVGVASPAPAKPGEKGQTP